MIKKMHLRNNKCFVGLILVVLLITSTKASGQISLDKLKYTLVELKYGHWEFTARNITSIKFSGHLKIIPRDTSLRINKLFEADDYVSYNDGKLSFHYSGYNDSLVSVYDGVWEHFKLEDDGRWVLFKKSYYDNGFLYKEWEPASEHYEEHEFRYKIKDGEAITELVKLRPNEYVYFKKYDFTHIKIFYPYSNISFNKIYYHINATYDRCDTLVHKFMVNKIDTLFIEHHPELHILSSNFIANDTIILKNIGEDSLYILHCPQRSGYDRKTWLNIKTTSLTYRLDYSLYATDVGKNNMDSSKTLVISKSGINDTLFIEYMAAEYALYDHPVVLDVWGSINRNNDHLAKGYISGDPGHSGPLYLSKLEPGLYYLAFWFVLKDKGFLQPIRLVP